MDINIFEMKTIGIFLFIMMLIQRPFCQEAVFSDEKTIYLKIITTNTGHFKNSKDSIFIYDSTANWDSRENLTLLSVIKNKQKTKTQEWDSTISNFQKISHIHAVNSLIDLREIKVNVHLKFLYISNVGKKTNLTSCWRMSLYPLYFNRDRTKCFTASDFLIGWCGTGAKRYHFFQKDKKGNWDRAERLFVKGAGF